MKKYLFIVLILIACKKRVNDFPGTWYGEKFNYEEVTTSLAEISDLELISDTLSRVYQGTIHETCHVEGCWMTVENVDGAIIRVNFKDEAFTVPKSGVYGKLVLVYGVLSKKDVSKEESVHLAEDLGYSHERAVKMAYDHLEYRVRASGVFIQD